MVMSSKCHKKLPTYQLLAMFTSNLNGICSGMFLGWSSPYLPKLLSNRSRMSVTNDEGSWIIATFLFGCICGSLLATLLIDRIGRKNVILLTSPLFFTAWLMIAYVPTLQLLLFARCLAGISSGMVCCSISTYLPEIADPKIRGFIGCNNVVSNVLGVLVINILGSYLTIKDTALIALILPTISFVTFAWMPESPYYLIMKGKIEQARASLTVFKETHQVEGELNRLVQAIEEQNANGGSYLDLFTVKSNRKALGIVVVMRFVQQFTGVVATIVYAQMIFKDVGDYNVRPSSVSMICFTIQLLASTVSTLIVDKAGRKPLLILSTTGVSLITFAQGCYFYMKHTTDLDTKPFALASLIGFVLLIILDSMGMQTIPLLLAGEMFPTNVKAFAASLGYIYLFAVMMGMVKSFQFAKDEFGLQVPFFAFSICNVLGLIFVLCFVPETKGKTLERILEELKGKPANKNIEVLEEKYTNIVMSD